MTAGLARISAGDGDPAESRRQVERPAPVAVVDGDGLSRVQPDPDRERERRVRDGLVDEPPLELDRRPDRLSSGVEDRHDLVPAELQIGPASGLEDLARHRGELAGQHRGGLVAALLREDRVPADVGDQERPDLGVVAACPVDRPSPSAMGDYGPSDLRRPTRSRGRDRP